MATETSGDTVAVENPEWRIRRYHQPYHALASAIEVLCAWTGHFNACMLLNRRRGFNLSGPYQWLAYRAETWEPLPPYTSYPTWRDPR